MVSICSTDSSSSSRLGSSLGTSVALFILDNSFDLFSEILGFRGLFSTVFSSTAFSSSIGIILVRVFLGFLLPRLSISILFRIFSLSVGFSISTLSIVSSETIGVLGSNLSLASFSGAGISFSSMVSIFGDAEINFSSLGLLCCERN